MTYYSEELSWEVFRHQTVKFTTNRLEEPLCPTLL